MPTEMLDFPKLSVPSKRFRAYAWSVLGVNLFVIIWGAYVRASLSGAGCGAHWPLCNGEIIPSSPAIETIVEFIHRLSSGAALLLVLGMLVYVWRTFPKGHALRLGAAGSAFFMLTEALLGAALVKFEWVAGNVSLGRVVSGSFHLVNTFLLLLCLTLTAWWASGGSPVRLKGSRLLLFSLGLGFLGVLVLGVTGSITALGDTLFPSSSLAAGIAQDFSPTAHFLIRLRVYHPLIAILVGFYTAFLTLLLRGLYEDRWVKRFSTTLGVLFLLQLCVGVLNLLLLVPYWTQLTHLLLADLVWITLVLVSAALFADPGPAVQPITPAREAASAGSSAAQ
jgi:heme A synthase